MAKGEFDEIKDKLYGHEEPVDTELWQDIQGSLRRRRIRRIFYRALSSAAVIAAIFLALTSIDRHKMRELEYFAQMISSMPVPAAVVESNVQREILPLPQIQKEETTETYQEAQDSNDTEIPLVKGSHKMVMQVLEQKNESDAAVAEADAVKEAEGEMQGAVEDSSAGGSEGKSHVGELNMQSAGNATVGRLYYDDWNELPQMERDRGKRYAMAFTGGLMPGSSASVTESRIMAVSAADDKHHGYMVEQVSDTKYSLPVNLGVQLQFPLGENLALGVGVSYTKLRSKFDCLVNKVRYSGQQTLHYIGIPVNVYGKVAQRNRFAFYVNGGAMIEKGVRAKYKFSSYKDSYTNSTKMEGLQFSVNAGLGVEYKLADYVGLYFEPNIIYFTNSDMQYCVRTDQPLQIKAELGCRFHF